MAVEKETKEVKKKTPSKQITKTTPKKGTIPKKGTSQNTASKTNKTAVLKEEKELVKKEKVIQETKKDIPLATEVKDDATIPKQKKLIVIGIILFIVLFGFYLYRVYDVKKEEKLMNSYLLSSGTISLNIQSLDEVNQVLFSNETPDKFFVLISYTDDEDAYELEESLKSIIDNYKLNDCFYYLNVKDIMKEDNYLDKINQTFNTKNITKLPTILYYESGQLQEVVKRVDNHVINAGDFQKLLDIYEF